jgi:hypothetical protein
MFGIPRPLSPVSARLNSRHPFLLLALACQEPAAPLPPGAASFSPPAIYREWWTLTEECSGQRGDFHSVRWYVVPDAQTLRDAQGREIDAYWEARGNRIVIANASQHSGDLVRHEMLHALIRADGHPREQFLNRCAGIVVCITSCITDAGPAPAADPAAIMVDPIALDVRISLTPSIPSGRLGEHFWITVTARNPLDQPVIVRLPPMFEDGPPVAYGYEISRLDGLGFFTFAWPPQSPETFRFSPRETKRQLFDFRVSTGNGLREIPPGRYRFEGFYGKVPAKNPPTVTLAP